jgi:hypothetical protein
MKLFIAFFVKNDRSRAIEIAEIVETTDLSVDDLTRRTIKRTNELHALFPIDRYDVYSVSYSSLEAMLSTNRDFDLDPAKRIVWNSDSATVSGES